MKVGALQLNKIYHPANARVANGFGYDPPSGPALMLNKGMAPAVRDAAHAVERLAQEDLILTAGMSLLGQLVGRLDPKQLPRLSKAFAREFVVQDQEQAARQIEKTLAPLTQLPTESGKRIKAIHQLARKAKDPKSDAAKQLSLLLLVLASETPLAQEAKWHQRHDAPAAYPATSSPYSSYKPSVPATFVMSA